MLATRRPPTVLLLDCRPSLSPRPPKRIATSNRSVTNEFGHPTDNWVRQSFAMASVANGLDRCRNATGERAGTLNPMVAPKAKFTARLPPLLRRDVPNSVLAANLHCQFQTAKGQVGVRQGTGQIVQGCQPNCAAAAMQNTVVLGVRIRSRNHPVEHKRIEERVYVVEGPPGVVSDRVNESTASSLPDFPCSRAMTHCRDTPIDFASWACEIFNDQRR